MSSPQPITSHLLVMLLLSLCMLLLPQQWLVNAAPSSPSDYTVKADEARPALDPSKASTSTLAPAPTLTIQPTSPSSSTQTKRAQSLPKQPSSPPLRTAQPRFRLSPSSKVTAPSLEEKRANPQLNYSVPQTSQEDQSSSKPKDKENEDTIQSVAEVSDGRNNDRGKDNAAEATSPEFTWQTFVIITITILIVLSNCAIIMVVAWTEAFSNFNKIFIYSLALADLLIGLCITPYSIFLSVYRTWVFDSDIFCSVEAYMFTTLISAKMYSLTWLNVDQYVAVRKPERYNSMMTPARSLCWICFSWVVVISFCCPPLFSLEASIFDRASYICMIDTKQQIAYVLTAGVLVCTPSMVTTLVTGAYLFTKSFKKQIQFYEKVFVDLCSRPWNYHITFTMSAVFFGVWFPFSCVYTIRYFLYIELDQNLLFVLCWLGISTGFSQFIVLFAMSPEFRRALRELIRFPEFCRSGPDVTDSVPTGRVIEARNSPPPAYLTFFERQTSLDAESSNMSPSPRSLSKGAGDRRKQSQRSGTHGSGSTSTSSIPYVDALGSVTGMQYRGVYNTGTPPTHV
ncbi:dopamine/ecdysteroid receptor [Elysia marginata]|uniref:Dopamine/ecdysteroid receptor n=1 Tax=Elysia marginata TaxID=1093978 RepID=A0AAV4JKY8_9GAST|nr:dopamine/ecdysteroid receptor [Elysia marginata]